MKETAINKLVITAVMLASLVLPATTVVPNEDTFPPGFIKLVNARVDDVVAIYKGLTGQALVTASNVKGVPGRITLQTNRSLTRSEATKLLEQSLLEQAGVIVTRLDDKRVSVTYNDALAIRSAQSK